MDVENIEFNSFKITTPEYVGEYRITGKDTTYTVSFSFVKKPNIIHRFFCRLLLGWIWVDNK